MQPPYPERLIPSKEKVNKVRYTDSCHLCRRSDLDFDSSFDEEGELHPMTYDQKELFNLSTNLVNSEDSCSEIESCFSDVLFKYVKDSIDLSFQKWDDNDDDIPDIKTLKFDFLNEKSFIIIPIGNILNFKTKFPFTKNEKNSTEKEYELSINLIYSPVMINVMHYEFQLLSDFTVDGHVKKGSFSSINNYRYQVITKIKEFVQKNALKKSEVEKIHNIVDSKMKI